MQQGLDGLRTQDGALLNDRPAEQEVADAPLPPLPEYARSTVQVGGHAPAGSLSPAEAWQPADAAREPIALPDEGPDVTVQGHLQPLVNIGSRDGARGTQPPATGWQGSGTIQLSGDNGSMPSDTGQQGADTGRSRTDSSLPPSSAQSTGTGQGGSSTQGTSGGQGGAQSASTNGGGQSASNTGGGAAASGGGQAADAGAAPSDNQQAGTGTHIPEVIDIQASDMQWDPAHAHLHQGDGELFMFSNSSADAQFTLDTQGQGLSVFARADKANGQWPTLTVSIDGTEIGSITVNSTTDKKFYLPISVDPGQVNLQLSYTNDFYDPNAHQDRNVYISHIKVVAQGTQGQ